MTAASAKEWSDAMWIKLGAALRQSADDAHGVLTVTPFYVSWDFMKANPECFIDADEWPADFPAEAPISLIAGYYGISADQLPEVAAQ